ncbi:hypothetical protein [Geobacter sp. DSM 9736]|uniref:hypothetical protein n=1 Tax=Geobacter sp. DSM 9736 TaxID=1277350 RepID=UPI000B4FE72C|nr:hypothetical protein [Geobacter sp. DSM 9736]SNB45529.1 hypothetical protein SAMN06269301_0947 [Geobacter sp. DSM 9736]
MNFKTITVAVAVSLSVSSVVYAGGTHVDPCVAASAETVKQFRQNTSELRGQLSVKELELRQEYGYEGIDMRRVEAIEGEIREIKEKIKTVAKKLNLEPGSCYQL